MTTIAFEQPVDRYGSQAACGLGAAITPAGRRGGAGSVHDAECFAAHRVGRLSAVTIDPLVASLD